MNRNEEFDRLLEELEREAPASLEPSLEKARRRKRRSRRLFAPLGSVAAVFALFVVLVNFSATVANACSQIPFIRELAAAVTFSPSLSDAVDNEFVQPMNQVQEKNGITATVESLIVDQKQVNVFYRLDSQEHTQLEADLDVLNLDGTSAHCSLSSGSFNTENGELRHMDIDYLKDDVPDALRLILRVYSNEALSDREPDENQDHWDVPDTERDYLAEFDLLLQFDPKFTEAGEVIPVNQTVELDGQKITFTDVEIYPSHMRVDVQTDPGNTAWMKGLDFYILANGKKFEPISNGTTATGTLDSKDYTSYRADSAYFHKADKVELVITGATWLSKENSMIHLDLNTGEHDPLPQDVEFRSVEPYKDGWTVSFRAPLEEDGGMYQLFSTLYWDAQGKEYSTDIRSSYFDRDGLKGSQESTHFIEEFPLKDYPFDQVWLELTYSSVWTAPTPITIPVR